MKTTTIRELQAHVERLMAAGFGDTEIVAHTTGRHKTALQDMNPPKETLEEQIRRQVESSITVRKAIEMIAYGETGDDRAYRPPVYLTFDGGGQRSVDELGVRRSEDGTHYIVSARSTTKPWGAQIGLTLADMRLDRTLTGMLDAEQDKTAAEDIRLVACRGGNPRMSRHHAIGPGSIDNPRLPGRERAGPVVLQAALVMR